MVAQRAVDFDLMEGAMGPNVNRMGEQSRSVSTWSPLRIGVFRAMWIAVLVANIGTWMQTVGAQWLLVYLPHAAILVALVQTADFLPDVLFGLVRSEERRVGKECRSRWS